MVLVVVMLRMETVRMVRGWRKMETMDLNRVLNYWATRLRPFWANSKDVDGKTGVEEGTRQSASAHANEQPERDVIVVVACNQFGYERGAISMSYRPTHASIFSYRQSCKTFPWFAMFACAQVRANPYSYKSWVNAGVCVWTARVGSCTLSSSYIRTITLALFSRA